MNNDLFAHAWARCDRAGEIARQMVEIWNGYIADHPYTPVLIGQGEGVFILRVYEDTPMPETFAVAVGEWINHLRSALDYTIWAAAAHASGEVPPPGQGQLQYPIYDSLAAWKANLYRLAALGDHHRAMLLTMQPFNSDTDANYLGWINRIARSDRHRHLSRMAGYIAELEPALMAPAGCPATLQWGERAIYDGYADVARVVVSPWSDGMEVEINPRRGLTRRTPGPWGSASERDLWPGIYWDRSGPRPPAGFEPLTVGRRPRIGCDESAPFAWHERSAERCFSRISTLSSRAVRFPSSSIAEARTSADRLGEVVLAGEDAVRE